MRCWIPRNAVRLLIALLSTCLAASPAGPFLVKPYLQLGNSPTLDEKESLLLMWHAAEEEVPWTVEIRKNASAGWSLVNGISWLPVTAPPLDRHRIYTAVLRNLKPGVDFDYRVQRGGDVVFASRGRPRKRATQPCRYVVFGDCGTGTPAQRAVAYQTHHLDPDFVFVTGDVIQYGSGRVSEYRTHYYPIYNADEASPSGGVPLLRSRLFFSTIGNHDVGSSDLDKTADGLGYFVNWRLPLNGPLSTAGAPNTIPLKGSDSARRAFLTAAGNAFPKMTMYSFDYGNSHWTVFDGNAYVDWTDYELRNWVARDLAAAKSATWKFASFHQAAFDSNGGARYEKMAIIADVLEHGGVDIVFNGNTHNYQRSHPIRFMPKPGPCGRMICDWPRVDGDINIDRGYDGVARTRANGVIYIITGAGGSGLDEAQQTNNPATWQPFTRAFIADVPSLTVVDVDGRRLTVRQVSGDGQELDRFTLTK